MKMKPIGDQVLIKEQEKAGKTDTESDKIAVIRTIIVICYLVTNCFIVAGVIRHW